MTMVSLLSILRSRLLRRTGALTAAEDKQVSVFRCQLADDRKQSASCLLLSVFCALPSVSGWLEKSCALIASRVL